MNFKLEKKLKKQGYQIIIGVDEAGRGPLAGPVVAAAVVLRDPLLSRFHRDILSPKGRGGVEWDLIRDSKKLSEKQRERLFDFIQENFYVGVGMCDHKTIDRINILQATYLAAKKAIVNLFKKINQETRNNNQTKSKIPNSLATPDLAKPDKSQTNPKPKIQSFKTIILFDGNRIIPNLNYKQQVIVGGDRKIKSIAAASIIAKVTRDRLMLKMHQKFPQYGFDKHKGYGTKIHLQNLKKHGPSIIHRLSFRPVHPHTNSGKNYT